MASEQPTGQPSTAAQAGPERRGSKRLAQQQQLAVQDAAREAAQAARARGMQEMKTA